MAWVTHCGKPRPKPWLVRWREGSRTRSKSFATEEEANAYASAHESSAAHIDATEAPQDRACKYSHSPADDEYVFQLPTRVLTMSGDDLRRMLGQYSHHGEGWAGKLVATHNDLTEREFRSILKAIGFVKGDYPYTDEEAAEVDPDVLADEMVRTRRTDIDRRIIRKRHREQREDAAKWRNLDESVLAHVDKALEYVCSAVQPAEPRDIRRAPEPYALLLPVTDLHVGKYSWGGYGPGAFSTARAQQRLGEAIDSVLSWLPGRPERIILPIGGDFFQADGVEGKTSRGTAQDIDGTPEQMICEGWGIAFALVAELAAVAPVHLVYNRGNHDAALSLALFRSLELAHADDERVTFSEDERRYSPYQVVEYGCTAIGFAHGDGRSKPHELATLMAQRWPSVWARCPRREWHLGHVHHTRVVEESGVTLLTNPSLSGNDRYHELHWPHASVPQLAAHVYDRTRGRVATVYGVPNV